MAQPIWCLGASFDCQKSKTAVERLVCSSNEIKILDVELYEAYQRAQRLSVNAGAIRNQQRRWLKESRNSCNSVGCLSQVYKKRISELTASIRYKECKEKDGYMTTVDMGYCEERLSAEAEATIDDLVERLSERLTAQQIKTFAELQDKWRENVVCDCRKKVGNIWGPGDSLNSISCKKEWNEKRLVEIRAIVAGVQDLKFGRTGPESCAKIRAEKEADPEYQMIQAIAKNDISTVKRLLKDGTKMPRGDYSYTPIDIAVRNNNSEMLSFLLANGADPKNDVVAMRAALKICNMTFVSLLIDYGYQVKGDRGSYRPYDPLRWAALHGCTGIVEYLVSKGADIESSKPLRLAVMQCHVETVRYFLSKGHDPDLSDHEKRTPLWYAAIAAVNFPDKRKACIDIVNDLLQAGANPERAFIVPKENPALKLPRDDDELVRLLHSKSRNKEK